MISDGWFDMTIFGMLIRWHLHTARLKWPETNEISSVTAPISTRSAVALLVTSSCLGCFTCLFVLFFFNSHTKGAVHFWMLFVVQQSQPGKCSCVIYWVVFLRLKAPKRSWQLWNRWLKKVSPVMLGMMVMNHGVTSLAMILGYIWCDSTSHLWDSFQSLVNACTQAFAWPLAFMFFYIKLGCTFGAIRGLTYIREDGRVPSLCCGW
jgi:hypothetical protein